MKARLLATVALALALGAAAAAAAPAASGPRSFSFRGAGTNYVNIQTGELRELWKGKASPFGKVTTHVAGWIQRPNPKSLTVRSSMVIVVPGGDVLIGACSGTGTLPNPDGAEDWTCRATGGTGKFARSRGQWTLHIEIHRVSIANATQKNRFEETGSGRITWNPRG